MIVVAQLFRLDGELRIRRPPSGPAGPPSTRAPAVLVIPRDGRVLAPHLLIVTGPRRYCGVPPGALVLSDPHVVAGDGDDRAWRQAADVFVRRRPALRDVRHRGFPALLDRRSRCGHGAEALLDRYPGCEVVVDEHRRGRLLSSRDGHVLRVTGAAGLTSAHLGGWADVCGSTLHCWALSGLPPAALAGAIVIAGRHGEGRRLDVAGRLHFQLVRAGRTGLHRIA